jgi:hypothetical protein
MSAWWVGTDDKALSRPVSDERGNPGEHAGYVDYVGHDNEKTNNIKHMVV